MDRMQSERVDLLQVGRRIPRSTFRRLSVDGSCHKTLSIHITHHPFRSSSPVTPTRAVSLE